MNKRAFHATVEARWGGMALALALGCGEEPVAGPCPAENQAPLRNGPGAARPFECVVVGATTSGGAAEWAAVDALPSPRVFVSSRAAAGGDGSRERPFDSLAAGAAALAATGGALVVARGQYPLAATLSLPPGTALIGAGASATTIAAPHGRAAVEFISGRGEVRSLTVRFAEGPAVDDDVGIAARSGVTLTLDDVRVELAATGVGATGATVTATRLTALRSAFAGVRLDGGSRGVFSRLWVHHGTGYGVRASGSVVHLSDSLITCNGITGLWVRGAPPAMSGAASCAGDLSVPSGDTMCWRRVAFDENKPQGVDVAVCREGEGGSCVGSAGRIAVEASLLSVRRTGQRGSGGGDGISVGPYTRLRLDADVSGAAARGLATLVADNKRAGLLVAGPEAVVTVHGARIANNFGPGVYLQAAARAEELNDTVVSGNIGLGVGATPSSSLGAVLRNQFLGTTVGALVPGGGVTFGDGLAISQRTGLTLMANEFNDNQRYAAFMTQVETATITGNMGDRNRYGLAAYDSRVDPRVGNSVGAREAAPAVSPPTVTDGMLMR